MITADHGCDPGDVSTDHTREYIPLLIIGKEIKPTNLGTRTTFADISATICEMLGVSFETQGESFAVDILK
jgi:phosphopentomutase